MRYINPRFTYLLITFFLFLPAEKHFSAAERERERERERESLGSAYATEFW